jgi:outer membrane beta-barrel protein
MRFLHVGKIVLFALIAMMSSGNVWAKEDEYHFRWLDPDKKIYVLQNRKFEKAKHVLINAMFGPNAGTPFRSSVMLTPRISYYFKEWIGIEAFFSYTFNWENTLFDAVLSVAPSNLPVVRETRMQYGGAISLVPWYAKMNFFNQILYFDWYFNLGLGGSSVARDDRPNRNTSAVYVNETFFTGFLSTGHLYHINRWVHVRLDFTAALYAAPNLGATGTLMINPNYVFGAGVICITSIVGFM